MKNTLVICTTIGFVAWLLLREQPTGSRLAGSDATDKLSGSFDKLKGAGKQVAGKLTGDDSMRAEGLVDEALGAVKRGVGQTVEAAKDATRSLTNS